MLTITLEKCNTVSFETEYNLYFISTEISFPLSS